MQQHTQQLISLQANQISINKYNETNAESNANEPLPAPKKFIRKSCSNAVWMREHPHSNTQTIADYRAAIGRMVAACESADWDRPSAGAESAASINLIKDVNEL